MLSMSVQSGNLSIPSLPTQNPSFKYSSFSLDNKASSRRRIHKIFASAATETEPVAAETSESVLQEIEVKKNILIS